MTPQLQKPAPDFSGTAVVNGQFKDLKLSDFKGKYLVSVIKFAVNRKSHLCFVSFTGAFLLPIGLVSIYQI